ncbi:MAG: hypothetical protein AABM67_22825, partial [Acidobacteriota bacterium]
AVSARFDLRKNVTQLIEAYGIAKSCQKPDGNEGQFETIETGRKTTEYQVNPFPPVALPNGRASDTF